MAKNPIIWKALEYEHREKTPDWYWAVGIIAVSISLIAFILGNVIFGIVVLVSLFALIVSARRVPQIVEFELNKTGLRIGAEFFPYNSLRSFWVENNTHADERSQLFFRPRSITAPMIIIPIEEVDPDYIREHLLMILLEEEHAESRLTRLFDRLGF